MEKMEDSEKELLENAKNIDTKKLFMNQKYIEIQLNDSFKQAFIYELKGNDRFKVFIQNINGINDISINIVNYYGENELDNNKIRNNLINLQLPEIDIEILTSYLIQQLQSFNIKIGSKKNSSLKKGYNYPSPILQINDNNKIDDKNGKKIDITGFFVYQFFCGYILDCLSIISRALSRSSLDESQKILFLNVLDTIIYAGDVVKSNLKKYKTAYYNRKLLIVSQIHAIITCFDSLIITLRPKYQYNYSEFPDIESRFTEISNLVYQIILLSKEANSIPLPCLIIFIHFLTFENVNKRIKNYDSKKVYDILNCHLKNLNENELKFYKKNGDMKNTCKTLVKNLFEVN